MPPEDLDALFGADAEHGVVAKAQLRFRVHPPRHPAARDVFDRVVAAYDEQLATIVRTIDEILRHPDRDADRRPLVLGVDAPTVAKAGTPHAPFRPGSRGGTWYRDKNGNVRYGTPPEGRFTGFGGDQLKPSEPPPIDHYRPRSFMGSLSGEQLVANFMIEHGAALGFSEGELRFLSTWYGTGEEGGELLDAFLECAGLTRDDLKDGTADLRFGTQQLTYEEAVLEFFAAQGALFMGEEPSGKEQLSEWHRLLNDEIKPLLDGVFLKYESAKANPDVQQQFAGEPDRQRRRFYAAARRDDVSYEIADSVVGDWNPERQFGAAVAGLRALGLIASPARTERAAYIHGRPHLRDVVTTDGRMLGPDPGNPLLDKPGKLARLSATQLMLLYAASELHRRWDPHTRSFSAELQADAGNSDLGDRVLAVLDGKSDDWAEASGVVRDRLSELVDHLVQKLNRFNSREGTPEKHGPVRRKRTR